MFIEGSAAIKGKNNENKGPSSIIHDILNDILSAADSMVTPGEPGGD